MRGWSRKFCSCLPGGRVTIVVAVAPQQVVGTKHNTCRIVLHFIVVGLLLSKIILAFSILSQTWTWVHCRNTKREPYSTAESHKQTHIHIHIHMHTYVNRICVGLATIELQFVTPAPTKAAHVGRPTVSSSPRHLPLQFTSGGLACLVGWLSLLHPRKANSININSNKGHPGFKLIR